MDDTARFDRLVAALHEICREFLESDGPEGEDEADEDEASGPS